MSNSILPDNLQLADNIPGDMPGIPREAILDTVPRSALAATKKIVNLIPISAGSIGPAQTIQFLIPQRAMAKAHSFYLKFKMVANTVSAGKNFSFSGAIQSCAALFNNLTLQAGGVVVESLQNYHVWHNNIVGEWASHGNDRLAIESMCSGSALPQDVLGKAQATAVATCALAAGATSTINGSSLTVTQGAFQVGDVIMFYPLNQFSRITAYDYATDVYTIDAVTLGAGGATQLWGLSGHQWSQDQVGFTDGSASSAGYTATVARRQWIYQFKSNASSTVTTNFSMPIYAGMLNPKESQLVPLQFINGGVLLTLQTNPISKAFCALADGDVTNFSLSEFELCYAEITPAPEYIMRVREEMMGAKRIRIEAQSYQQYLIGFNGSGTTSVNQLMNANLTSLSAVLWGIIEGTDTQATNKCFIDKVADGNTNTFYEILFDNVPLYNSVNRLNIIAARVRQLQEALGSTVSDVPVAPHTVARGVYKDGEMGTYVTQNALFGLSTKLFASNSTSMDGMAVSTLTFNFSALASYANALIYAFLVYDYIYTIDVTGGISKFA